MDTDFFRERVPDCMVQLIDAHGLDIRVDDFGMGKEVYLNRELLGYWFESNAGIEFQAGRCQHRVFDNWQAFCEWLDKRIRIFKAMDEFSEETP